MVCLNEHYNYWYLLPYMTHGLTRDQWYLLALLNQDTVHIVILLVIIKVYCIQFC